MRLSCDGIPFTRLTAQHCKMTRCILFLLPSFHSSHSLISLPFAHVDQPPLLSSLSCTIINLLTTNPFVIVIAFDFSKVFDIVRHSMLLHKCCQLDIPDHIYNWLVEYFHGHVHCTRYHGQTSALRHISASIIQGSSIGLAAYVVTAAGLCFITPGNSLCK